MKKQLLTLVVALGLIAVASQAALVTVGSTTVNGYTFTLAYDTVSTNLTNGSATTATGHAWYGLRVYCSDPTVKIAAFDATFRSNGTLNQVTPLVENEDTGEMVPTALVFNDKNGLIQLPATSRDDTQFTWAPSAGNPISQIESNSILSSGLGFAVRQDLTAVAGVADLGFNIARVAFTSGNDISSLISGVYNAQGTLTAGSGVNLAFNTGVGANQMANIAVNIPEPMTLALVAFGGLAMLRRRK